MINPFIPSNREALELDQIDPDTLEGMKKDLANLKNRLKKFNEDWRQRPVNHHSEDIIRASNALNEAEKYVKQYCKYGTGDYFARKHLDWLKDDLERFNY